MLTPADIQLLQTAGIKTNFFTGYRGTNAIFGNATTTIPSVKDKETYAWLGSTPRLREWRDERVPKALLEHGFTIVNKDWESSLAVDRNARDDDQYGQVKIRAAQLGQGAKTDQDLLFAQTVEAGSATACYDGQFFFDTDHAEGASGTQLNYFNGASYVFGSPAIKAAVTAMQQYKDDTGRIAGFNPDTVMVPSGLGWAAQELLNPSAVNVTTDPSKKILAGRLQIIENPYLTNNGTAANSAWYLLDLSQVVKPFIYQLRKDFEFVALDKPDSYEAFMRKTFIYGVDARFNFGFGDWRGAVRLGNT